MAESHTGEHNPADPALREMLYEYRAAVNNRIFNDSIPVHDRLQTLFATQFDMWQPYRSEPTIATLQRAEANIIKIGRVVGWLDRENPWSFARLSDLNLNRGTSFKRHSTFAANFRQARIISDTERYWHTSYNQTSERTEKRPYVTMPDSNTIPLVTLSRPDQGSETLALEIKNAAQEIAIGYTAIHASLGDNVLLHAAFTEAVNNMSASEHFANR
jgi:hypothetical protein